MSQKQKCATCSVVCRGNKCKACYQSSRKSAVADGTVLFSDLFSSQTDERNERLTNAAFSSDNAPGVENVLPEVPPTSVEDLYSLFVRMRSEFGSLIKQRDATIASLAAKVETLEKAVKKKESVKPQDEKILTEIKEEYSSNMKTIKETVAAQQKTIEDLQHDKRIKNLVITGVPEPSGASQDIRNQHRSTIDSIFAAVECAEVKPSHIKRLGVKQQPPSNTDNGENQQASAPPRPILVTLNTAADVRMILKKRYTLKNNATFSNVYVKTDDHPLVRKEWNRLREVARKEKSAPINAGCVIKLDYKKKAVTRNGEVIDEFVSPFRLQGPNASA